MGLSFQFCPPSGRKHADSNLVSGHSISLNLGEVLRGDRIRKSDYELEMGKDQECRLLCKQKVDRRAMKRARELIAGGYVAEWIVDNLPGATRFVTVDKSRRYYAAGFQMGRKDYSPIDAKPRYVINNHVTLVLRWRKAPGKDGEQGRKVIVGFEVYPKSVGLEDRDDEGCPNQLHDRNEGMEMYIPSNHTDNIERYRSSSYTPKEEENLDDGATLEIPYTYSVYFLESDKVEWANRWDLYFMNQEDSSKVHWLAIINSLIISGLLTAVVAVIFTRTIHNDLKGYNSKDGPEEGKIRLRRKKPTTSGLPSPRRREKSPPPGGAGLLDQHAGDADHDADISSGDDDSLEEITGWKLLHGDVFRPPACGGLLAPLIGSGMQLVFMAGGLLILSCFGVLNPSFRGGFVSVGIGLFVFAGVFSGYFSGRVYHTFGGPNWRGNALMVCVFFLFSFFPL